MQVTLPQQSTVTSDDCDELYCRSTRCHLLMDSGTAAICTNATAGCLQGLDQVKITLNPQKLLKAANEISHIKKILNSEDN